MLFFAAKGAAVLKYLETDKKQGLTEQAAVGRIGQYGENRLREAKKTTFFAKFIRQFADVMVLILLAAAGISFVLAFHGGDKADYF